MNLEIVVGKEIVRTKKGYVLKLIQMWILVTLMGILTFARISRIQSQIVQPQKDVHTIILVVHFSQVVQLIFSIHHLNVRKYHLSVHLKVVDV